jgi:hypothetical protein
MVFQMGRALGGEAPRPARSSREAAMLSVVRELLEEIVRLQIHVTLEDDRIELWPIERVSPRMQMIVTLHRFDLWHELLPYARRRERQLEEQFGYPHPEKMGRYWIQALEDEYARTGQRPTPTPTATHPKADESFDGKGLS